MNKVAEIQNQMVLQILLSRKQISQEVYNVIKKFDTEVQSKLITRIIGSEK